MKVEVELDGLGTYLRRISTLLVRTASLAVTKASLGMASCTSFANNAFQTRFRPAVNLSL